MRKTSFIICLAASWGALGGEVHDAAVPVWKEGEIMWRTSERAKAKHKTLQELLAKGVDVNEQDSAGCTPLAAALKAYGALPKDVRHYVQLLPTLNALLDVGADPGIADQEGKDARYYMEQARPPQELSSLLLPANETLRRLVMQKAPLPPMALVQFHSHNTVGRIGKVVASYGSAIPTGAEILCRYTPQRSRGATEAPEPCGAYCPVSQWGIVLNPKNETDEHSGSILCETEPLPAEQLLLIKGELPAPLESIRKLISDKTPPVPELEYMHTLHRGDVQTQRRFLAQVDVNKAWDMSELPLFFDVARSISFVEHPEAFQALLDADADTQAATAPEHGGYTPLHIIMMRHPENTAPLLANGADPNARNADGCTPLMLAAKYTASIEARVVAIRSLIAAGAEVNATDAAGLTALHYAVTPEPITSWPHEGSTEEIAATEREIAKAICRIITELLAAGAEVNGRQGDTPMDILIHGRREGSFIQLMPDSIRHAPEELLRQAGGRLTHPPAQ